MDKSIRLQRTESVLKELLQEAISSLGDIKLNALGITGVRCSKGKYYAEVFIHPDFPIQDGGNANDERKQILSGLKKAEGILREYVLSASGWYKCPKLNFCFDDSLQKSKTLDEIFAQIAKIAKKSEKTNGGSADGA
ncbi:30S ribosome-binding factor RbfA [Helicobacter sp. 11S02596-1]|uniref:30S ribosome-binding factor RbfA n=1 Tax=Helicobacter sp. 11S02596-1 TaxID=1476194 RepID=UPI000BA6D03B|nr:30S ribosome-binding factor RbfA [Helicobacter sp. 11S02596-1]PAF43203.1 ribosome-binding factor A [Helicobacter sp. 11S02596-1]